MRAGYLTVLASRTFGAAPLLRPVTPSRFEPEAPQGGSLEIEEIREAGTDLAPATQVPARAEPAIASTAPQVDDLLLGFREPGIVEADHAPQAAPERRARPGVADTDPVPALPVGRAERRFDAPAGVEALARATAPSQAAAPPAGHAIGGEPAEPAWAGAFRASWPDGAIEAASSRQDPRTAGRSGDPIAGGGPAPPIVVHIGRVDVRAVHAPPPPAPKARPSVGPSLAEHLLARDRGRT